MNYKNLIISCSSLILGKSALAGYSKFIGVRDLRTNGFDEKSIKQNFYDRYDIQINLDEALKVGIEDEGKNIKFETFDNYSITVPYNTATGAFNKISL